MLPLIDISRIDVRIVVCDKCDDGHSHGARNDNEYSKEIKRWNFSLQQTGYPDHLTSIGEVSRDFADLSGESLRVEFSLPPVEVAQEATLA